MIIRRQFTRKFIQPTKWFCSKQPGQNYQNSFSDKMEKMQHHYSFSGADINWKIPILLCGSSLFIYYLWQSQPYGLIYQHFTISESIPKENNYHAILLAPLSFQTSGHFLLYGPALLYSSILITSHMNPFYFFLLYTTNALLTTYVTFAFERKQNQQLSINMISPKCVGATTPLALMSAFLAMKPSYLIFGSRIVPYFFIPALYYMYEINEYLSGYVTELCRPAHLSSITWGLIFGFAFKFLTKM